MSIVSEITNLSDHDTIIATNPRVIVFFGSSRCTHCKSIYPLYYQLAQQHPTVKFTHVEVTAVPVDNLSGVPTFVGYKNGNTVDLVVGELPDRLNDLVNTIKY